MQATILTISSLSLLASVGTLAIMLKMAKELKSAKDEVNAVKGKAEYNMAVVKNAMGKLEL